MSGPAASGRVVVQAFHVGYWDYIGWVDRFAAPAYTSRQRQLASMNGQRGVYTPQLVRNGQDWRDFAKALEDQPVAIIPFEPQVFGTAANNGQMIAEFSSGHRTAETFRQLAQLMTGRSESKRPRSGLIPPFIEKLLKRA